MAVAEEASHDNQARSSGEVPSMARVLHFPLDTMRRSAGLCAPVDFDVHSHRVLGAGLGSSCGGSSYCASDVGSVGGQAHRGVLAEGRVHAACYAAAVP